MACAIKELAHLQIPLQKILDATNNFSDKNFIGKGDFGNVYRGKLEHHGKMKKVAIRRLDRKYGHGDVEFWTEVSLLSSFIKKNDYMVAMIGFCDEKDEKIIINHHYPKGSLSQYISNRSTLDVNQRWAIAEMVCYGITRFHTILKDDYIIHRNINSSTILLNKSWKPRLSGFEMSIKHSKERKNEVVISEVIGTKGYIDPAIEKYGGVNHKSDIYSAGVVLFELLCGRKAFEENRLLAPLAKFHYEKGTLKDIIHPDIWNQMNPKSFKCFSKAAYSCLQDDPTLRPDAEELWSKLSKAKVLQDKNKMEKDEMQHEKHPIFENVLDRSSLDLWKVKKWEHLRIGLTHIHSPPPFHIFNFSPYSEDHVTFKQEIEYHDRQYVSFVEHKNTNELPKTRHTVMARMVEYKEDVFLREIEILESCRHPNIQSFIGFYDNGHIMMLFYEYFSKKNLYNSLGDANLKWGKRLKICIDVALGLDYLHNGMEDQKMVIHGDLNSVKIELDDILGARIVGFESSVIFHSNQNDDYIQPNGNFQNINFLDPEYVKTGKLNRESDVFSFGVVMLEILCGMPIHEISLKGKENEAIASLAQRWFDKGIIKKKLATGIKEEYTGNNLFIKKGPNEDSLDTFINIAYKCLAESQNQRPEIKVVIKELYKALSFHENHKDPLRMSFNDIKLATQDFDHANCIGGGGFGLVYKGKLAHGKVNGNSTIVAKKLDRSQGQGEKQYYKELQILYEYHHDNVIGLIGYSNETNEKLIVYEHASNGSLDKHLNNVSLTWRHRLKICIDVTMGLNFLHEGIQGQKMVIHRDIKTANILLFDDWKAKVGDFGLSLISTKNKETNFIIDHPCGTMDYLDPMYLQSSSLTKESDVYSFGVALFEILCGRTTNTIPKDKSQSLLSFIKYKFENGKQDELVFKAIKEEIVPESLTTFLDIVYKCLDDDREKRPTTRVILAQLKKTLEIQKEEDKEDPWNKSSSYCWKVKKLEHMRIEPTKIYDSSHTSHSTSSSNKYGNLVKKKIEYHARERKNKDELRKRYHTVTVKTITYNADVSLREIEILGSCKHPNIQSFLGFYDQDSTIMLFYEYVSLKYLSEFLYDKNLSWRRRLKICIDVAHGLDYLHNEMEGQKMVIHGDINSQNIELDDNWGAKIVGFENSIILHLNQDDDYLQLNEIACDKYYIDPEYVETSKLKRESDVFNFGVLMLEILCAQWGPDMIKKVRYEDKGLIPLVRRWFDEGTIKKKKSPVTQEEHYGNNLFLNKEVYKDSLDTFISIIDRCLAGNQNQRSDMKAVIKELQKALYIHENHKHPLRMSFNDIKFATRDFARANRIGRGSELVFKGKLAHNKVNGHSTIVAKKMDKRKSKGEKEYFNELQILYEYNHENIIGLIGYSYENDKKFIVYEHASNGSLDRHLNNATLTWRIRLKICIDVGTALNFLHGGILGQKVVIHRNIKTGNILLFDDWKAKVGGFDFSLISPISKETNFIIDHHPRGTPGYIDPMYLRSGILSVESDVYSFGVTLFEILCGREMYKIDKYESMSLLSFIKYIFVYRKKDEMVFKAIKEEIVPESLTTFLNIVYKCLDVDREKRPTIKEVLVQLEKALELQVLNWV